MPTTYNDPTNEKDHLKTYITDNCNIRVPWPYFRPKWPFCFLYKKVAISQHKSPKLKKYDNFAFFNFKSWRNLRFLTFMIFYYRQIYGHILDKNGIFQIFKLNGLVWQCSYIKVTILISEVLKSRNQFLIFWFQFRNVTSICP